MKINNLGCSNGEIIKLNELYFLPYNITEKRNPIRGFGGNTAIKKCKKLLNEGAKSLSQSWIFLFKF